MFTFQTDTLNFQANTQTERIKFFWLTFFKKDHSHKTFPLIIRLVKQNKTKSNLTKNVS